MAFIEYVDMSEFTSEEKLKKSVKLLNNKVPARIVDKVLPCEAIKSY